MNFLRQSFRKLSSDRQPESTEVINRAALQIVKKMLSYHRETALQGALVLAKSGKMELGDNILGLSSTTVI